MTVAIAAMNAEGVALAADSARTSTLPTRKQRSFHGHDKVFQLQASRTLGAMLYGDTRLAGIPWDTLLALFQEALPAGPPETVAEHLAAFNRWLMTAECLTKERRLQARDDRLAAVVTDRIHEAISLRADHKLVFTDFLVRLAASVEVLREELEVAPPLPGFETVDSEAHRRAFEKDFQRAIARACTGLDELPRNLQLRLVDLLAVASIRQTPLADTAGMVFAGFGAAQTLPALSSCTYYGYSADLTLLHIDVDLSIDDRTPAVIAPFSQPDEIEAFLNRQHPDLLVSLRDTWEQMTQALIAAITPMTARWGAGNEFRKEIIAESISKVAANVLERHGYRHTDLLDRWPQDVLNVAAGLPREQLAGVADGLVRLTILRQWISSELDETVGGAINVAVISLLDGFQWVTDRATGHGSRIPCPR